MKRGLGVLILALLLGIAAFGVGRMLCCRPPVDAVYATEDHTRLPELRWLRQQLDLNDKQFSEVSRLHLAYRPTCESLCNRIMMTHEKIRQLLREGSKMSPELTAALQENASIQVECQTALLEHVYQTAACLPPEKSKRYLEAVLPHVMELTPEASSTLQGH
ncbi:MAG: hypothetical protein WBE58_05060 [Verrucomicrobiales bacterium]|nr:hypothetical protein [Verrucomicrobiales bacterium]